MGRLCCEGGLDDYTGTSLDCMVPFSGFPGGCEAGGGHGPGQLARCPQLLGPGRPVPAPRRGLSQSRAVGQLREARKLGKGLPCSRSKSGFPWGCSAHLCSLLRVRSRFSGPRFSRGIENPKCPSITL